MAQYLYSKTPTGSHVHRSSLLAFVAQRRKSPGLTCGGCNYAGGDFGDVAQ